jgi:hypothetical protein
MNGFGLRGGQPNHEITTGKNAMANAISTFEDNPVPSQTMKIGATAALGTI